MYIIYFLYTSGFTLSAFYSSSCVILFISLFLFSISSSSVSSSSSKNSFLCNSEFFFEKDFLIFHKNPYKNILF